MSLQVSALDEHHLRDAFDCGNDEMNGFLRRYARQNEKRGLSRTFVLVDAPARAVIGYYSLCMAQVLFESIPEALRKGLPRYPLAVARLARLAVDKDHQRQGLGDLLFADAVERVVLASRHVAAHSLLIDALDDQAKAYYLRFGAMPLHDQPLRLLLPLQGHVSMFS